MELNHIKKCIKPEKLIDKGEGILIVVEGVTILRLQESIKVSTVIACTSKVGLVASLETKVTVFAFPTGENSEAWAGVDDFGELSVLVHFNDLDNLDDLEVITNIEDQDKSDFEELLSENI